MSMDYIKQNGEYLGYCPEKKGYLYSVFRGYSNEGNKQYEIVCISNNTIYHLIYFNAINQ